MNAIGKGLLLAACVAACVGTAPARDAGRDDAAQLREIKLVLWPRAYREQDVALLDRLLDPGFRLVGADGDVSDKAGELDWIARNKPSYDSFRYEIERLDIHGGDTAVVAGMGTVRGRRDGAPYTSRYRSTNVLVKRDGAWRAVASHVSMLPASR